MPVITCRTLAKCRPEMLACCSVNPCELAGKINVCWCLQAYRDSACCTVRYVCALAALQNAL